MFIEEEYYSDDEFKASAFDENRRVIMGANTRIHTQTTEEEYDPQEHKMVLAYLDELQRVDDRFDRAYACWKQIHACTHKHSLPLFNNVSFHRFMMTIFPLAPK